MLTEHASASACVGSVAGKAKISSIMVGMHCAECAKQLDASAWKIRWQVGGVVAVVTLYSRRNNKRCYEMISHCGRLIADMYQSSKRATTLMRP